MVPADFRQYRNRPRRDSSSSESSDSSRKSSGSLAQDTPKGFVGDAWPSNLTGGPKKDYTKYFKSGTLKIRIPKKGDATKDSIAAARKVASPTKANLSLKLDFNNLVCVDPETPNSLCAGKSTIKANTALVKVTDRDITVLDIKFQRMLINSTLPETNIIITTNDLGSSHAEQQYDKKAINPSITQNVEAEKENNPKASLSIITTQESTVYSSNELTPNGQLQTLSCFSDEDVTPHFSPVSPTHTFNSYLNEDELAHEASRKLSKLVAVNTGNPIVDSKQIDRTKGPEDSDWLFRSLGSLLPSKADMILGVDPEDPFDASKPIFHEPKAAGQTSVSDIKSGKGYFPFTPASSVGSIIDESCDLLGVTASTTVKENETGDWIDLDTNQIMLVENTDNRGSVLDLKGNNSPIATIPEAENGATGVGTPRRPNPLRRYVGNW